MDYWGTYATRSLTRCETSVTKVSNRVLNSKDLSSNKESYSIKLPETFYGGRRLEEELVTRVFGGNSSDDKDFF